MPLSQSPLEWLEAMWLPWICLALPLVAVYARMIRSKVLEVKAENYTRTSVAKGLSYSAVIRHELRGSLTPIVTMYGLDLSLLAGGSVIIERIFRIPGLGSLLLDARNFYDFPGMAGVVLLFSLIIIVTNLAVDLLYCGIDPRVRVGSPRGLIRARLTIWLHARTQEAPSAEGRKTLGGCFAVRHNGGFGRGAAARCNHRTNDTCDADQMPTLYGAAALTYMIMYALGATRSRIQTCVCSRLSAFKHLRVSSGKLAVWRRRGNLVRCRR